MVLSASNQIDFSRNIVNMMSKEVLESRQYRKWIGTVSEELSRRHEWGTTHLSIRKDGIDVIIRHFDTTSSPLVT